MKDCDGLQAAVAMRERAHRQAVPLELASTMVLPAQLYYYSPVVFQ